MANETGAMARSDESEHGMPGGVLGWFPTISGVTLALALLLGLLSLYLLRQTSTSIENDHTLAIRLERLFSSLKDLERGARGFLLTGQDSFLQPNNKASEEMEDRLQSLDGFGFDTTRLRAAVGERRAAATRSIDAYRRFGADQFRQHLTIGVGKSAMDDIETIVEGEQQHLSEHIDESLRREAWLEWPMAVLSVVMILVAFALVAAVAVRRLREQRLSEQRFRTLTEASAAIIWIASPAGQFETPQPSWTAFTGQEDGAEQRSGWIDAVHPDDRAETRRVWAKALKNRFSYEIEHRLRRADGTWRYMASRAVPVLDRTGSIREWVGTHTDITDRKEAALDLLAAKEAAEAANRAKSSFLANMSHELRTPLSAVIGYSEMLEEEVEDLGETGMLTDLGRIKSNARHLLSLINDVLDLSKIEANKMDVVADDFDVGSFARDVASAVDALITRRGNTLVLDLGDALGSMRSDVTKLRQCLLNLLGNAAKFTEKGTIELRIRRTADAEADWTTFAVSDSGIGMTPDQLQRLFQRFSQADETTTRRFGGTGLGLALSRAFARLLGGDITVESTEGQGTCFTIRVPASMPERRTDEDALPIDIDAPSPDVHRDLVLVIDDEASQRDLMTRFLERQRFDVRTAGDGRTGLKMARALKPKAILLDVMMPDPDGWSVLSSLKADADLATIPVVMVTFVDDTGRGEALGAADHVSKPVEWFRLKAVMDRLREAEGDVLVVDDDAEARQRLRTVLERHGWTVQEAGNGVEAMEHVLHAPPRVILLDLTMPVMDGFAFLHRLRDTPGCADIPVVVLSARDITTDERVRLATADRVLRKGDTSMRDLTSEIRSIEQR